MPVDYHRELGLDRMLPRERFVAELHRIRFETEGRDDPEASRRHRLADEALRSVEPTPAQAPRPDQTLARQTLSGPVVGPSSAELTSREPPAGSTRIQPASQPRRSAWHRAFSNLNLNAETPARIRPGIGDWGPVNVPSTRYKKRQRRQSAALFVALLLGLALLWYYFFTALTSRPFFF